MADSKEMVWSSLIHAYKCTMSAVSPVEITGCLNWWDWCFTKQRSDFPLVVHLFGGWYVALGNTYIPTERHKWLARSSLVRPKGAYRGLIKQGKHHTFFDSSEIPGVELSFRWRVHVSAKLACAVPSLSILDKTSFCSLLTLTARE